MASERSLLIVNYHSAVLTRGAIASARDASAVPLQIVVVDNSCDDAEVALLQTAGADHVVAAPRNLGYAGGINSGLPLCAADTLIISNPDVVFLPESIDFLVEELDGDAGLTGPSFVWDDAGQWMLPPPDEPSLWSKLSQVLATRSARWRRRRDRRRIRRRIEFWSRSRSFDVPVVSGAVMCTSRRLLESVGGFDEQFALYFEEIDVMRRLRGEGKKIRYVPRAVCRHIYNQSTQDASDAEEQYLQSETRYFRKWHGPIAVRLMQWFRPREQRHESARAVKEPAVTMHGNDFDGFLIEASPLESFDTAAGHFPHTKRVAIPPEVWAAYRMPRLYMRIVDQRKAQPLQTVSVAKSD